MVLRPLITLPPELAQRSVEFAIDAVAGLKAGRYPASSAVSCFGAEDNIGLWIRAKMAECAFCLYVGEDPEKLHWKSGPDAGDDLVWRGLRWDVKTTEMRNRCLIWPLGKNSIFEQKKFDMLVLVKNAPPVFQITGFVSKDRFRQKKKIAGAKHFLVEGTWFMEQNDLTDPESADLLIVAEAIIEMAGPSPEPQF